MDTKEAATGDQIQLQPGTKDRLERLGTLMGVPLPMLASHAVEDWLAQQERTLALIETLGDAVGSDMGVRLKQMLRTGLFARQQKMAGGPVLTEGQITAIAEQEDLSTAAAAGLGGALLESKEGLLEIARLIGQNAQHARARGQSGKAEEVEGVLAHFKRLHFR